MIKSMTGFGRGEYRDDKRNVAVEIRTVNHRYADVSIKLPRRYSFAEEKIRETVRKRVKRGKAEVMITVENFTEDDVSIRLNAPIVGQYISALRELKESYALEGDIDVKLISSMPDAVRAVPCVQDEDEAALAICGAVEAAASDLDEMRMREGAKLAGDLIMRGGIVREAVSRIGRRAPLISGEYRERLCERIREIVASEADIPEERILAEAAIFADKSNITEELIRLDSHIEQLDKFLKTGEEPVGKKLDFLVQEMNREANTIGSKANDLSITTDVLEAKSEIEKIREQVQNIE